MVGTIELDPDGKNLLIRFPYRLDLVEQVRSLPGRRWDKTQKVWRVSAKHAEAVYRMFSAHRFEFASDVSGILAGTVKIDGADSPHEPEPEVEESASARVVDALTVSQLAERVKSTLQGTFPDPVWVIGEVFGFDKGVDRSHRYFSLVEKAANKSQAAAQVDVVMFSRVAAELLPRLARGPDPLTLRDGIEVRARVRVDFYVPKSRFSLIVEDIDPEFTLGVLALDRDKILRELRDKGLDKKNSSLPLPRPPLRIGVLSSPDAEGWRDFHRQLEESRFGFAVTLHPVVVQGEKLKQTVLQGLSWFADRADQFDALCIVRGGGSRTDLAWFDDREVAFAVAQHPLKILCGIGHHRDRSVLDEITHSEKTPTAVAAFLVKQMEEVVDELRECGRRLGAATRETLRNRHRELVSSAQELRHRLQSRIATARGYLRTYTRVLRRAPIALVRDRVSARLTRSRDRLRHLTLGLLEALRLRLHNQEQRQRLLDPRRVLARGYALIFDTEGRILSDVARMKPGMDLDIRMRDGRARTRVDKTHRDS